MHELSIAQSLVETVMQHIQQNDAEGFELSGVRALHLRIGALSCVHQDSLQFCFGIVTEGTPLEGALLRIEAVPVAIYCDHCDAIRELPNIQSFRCPICNQPSANLKQGKELELVQIEFESAGDEQLLSEQRAD